MSQFQENFQTEERKDKKMEGQKVGRTDGQALIPRVQKALVLFL